MGRAETIPDPATGQHHITSGEGRACAAPKTCYPSRRTMPTYDYECQKCGNRFEVVQSMNDAKLEKCPGAACDGAVKRLLGTGAGIIFKGSGFYQTDYRSSSYQAGAKSENGASTKDSTPKSDTAAAPAAAPAPAAKAKAAE